MIQTMTPPPSNLRKFRIHLPTKLLLIFRGTSRPASACQQNGDNDENNTTGFYPLLSCTLRTRCTYSCQDGIMSVHVQSDILGSLDVNVKFLSSKFNSWRLKF